MLGNIIKGWLGEVGVNLGSKLFLNSKTYHQLNNVTIKGNNGTTQIDHIIVSIYGIFVVETKNYSGWIFGDENSSFWTQSVFGRKNKFQNPIRQNYRHIKILQEFLDLDRKCFHSIVFFIGECKLKTKLPEYVLCSGFSSYIKSKKEQLFSEEEIKNILEAINNGRLANSLKTRREHINSLHERHNSDTICPKCGGTLIERTANQGANAGKKFHGCSNFPKCRFIKK